MLSVIPLLKECGVIWSRRLKLERVNSSTYLSLDPPASCLRNIFFEGSWLRAMFKGSNAKALCFIACRGCSDVRRRRIRRRRSLPRNDQDMLVVSRCLAGRESRFLSGAG